jgi:hypothetical protein
MGEPILNQPWEDVADDVTGAIEKAVQPLLKKAVDDIYGGLLDATQDYLKDNLAFNIASRIKTAEREATDARQRCAILQAALSSVLEVAYSAVGMVEDAEKDTNWSPVAWHEESPVEAMRAILDAARAKGQSND